MQKNLKNLIFLCALWVGSLAFPEFIFIHDLYAAKFEVALEAEIPTKIQAPMQIGTPKDTEKWQKIDEPSRGKFVWMPGAPLGGGGDQGFAEYIVNIPESDTYAIWGRVIAWDGNSDSFWVTVQPPDPDENPQQTKNFEFRWATAQGNFWHWDRINKWLDAGTFDRQWKLPKGEVKITIWTREDATMLDALFITTSLDANEAAAGVRLPTEAEVKKQQTAKAAMGVDVKGKLAVRWAKMKKYK